MSFDLKRGYYLMQLIRFVEEEISNRYHPADDMRCPTHLSIGQEAAAVGVMMALQTNDKIFSNHRSHAHYLAKGGNINAMIAELYGKGTGCTGGWGGSMHLVDESVGFMGASPGVGDTIAIAVGTALSAKLSQTDNFAVAFFGDSAVETGQFWETANFAALHQLPLMLVCENNLYATATHISRRQPGTPIVDRVKGFMESFSVDDRYVEDVYEAALKCRSQGPCFLEILTYRYREHVGPGYDWDLGYRSQTEVSEHMAKDPLVTVRSKLLKSEVQKINDDVESQVFAAFQFAEASDWPKETWV